MRQDLIFVIILLATFSMINASHKKATTPAKCPQGFPLINTKLSPDPPVAGGTVNFTIYGALQIPITTGSELVIGVTSLDDVTIGDPFTTDFCTISEVVCPVTNFSVTQQVTMAATLPPSYISVVFILSPDGAPLGCSIDKIIST